MASMKVALECPRGNQAHKEVWVDPDDPKHTRECVACGYTWQYREGMPTYAGEFPPVEEPPPPGITFDPAAAMAAEAAPASTGESEVAGEVESAAETGSGE
jgi:hypothetical protein